MSFLVNRYPSKKSIVNQLVQFFPEHDIFIEPYTGSGIVALYDMEYHKPQKLYINDLHYGLYKRLKLLIDELSVEDINKFLFYRKNAALKLFLNIRDWKVLGDKVNQAYYDFRYFFLQALWEGQVADERYYLFLPKTSFINTLPPERWKILTGKTEIYNLRDIEFLQICRGKGLDQENTLIYLDPPYQGYHKWYKASRDFGFDWDVLMDELTRWRKARIFLSHHQPLKGWQVIAKFTIKRRICKEKTMRERFDYLLQYNDGDKNQN